MKARQTSGPLLSRRFRLVLLHLAEEARRDLDSLATRPVRAIHSLRTRMKNLRALLLLVKPRIPKPSRKAVNRLAVTLKDAFSEQRDAHVLAALHAKISGGRGTAAQEKATPQAARRNTAAKIQASRLIRMISKLTLDGLSWTEAISGYLESYREGRKALKACEHKPTAKAFHELRRPVKDLFYQSQALQPLDGMKERRRTADRLGERLGLMNDLHLLQSKAKKARDSRTLKHVEKKQRALRPAIFKAAAKLFGERPAKLGKTLGHCVKFQPAVAARAVRQT